MKKIVALFMAMAFALTLGTAFAEENAPAAAEKVPAAEKAPAKSKKAKHAKKHKHVAAPTAAGTATK